ncbi:hypothetical protein D1AOALGA4SA_10256 [Olavius algarvensis Delta 1 endosymbiont]|nr:hypothetical protein D1AOALGA4SA_10256 [Olavius algarvensis Delta 1 endosymbiont]
MQGLRLSAFGTRLSASAKSPAVSFLNPPPNDLVSGSWSCLNTACY